MSADETTSFKQFFKLCKCLSREPSYNNKTSIIRSFIKEHSKKGIFKGDLCLFAELLLPGTQKRVYNIKDKQILKLFAQIFQTDIQDMTKHLEDKGIVSDTIKTFFKDSSMMKPKEQSLLTLQEVDEYLNELSNVTKEEDQMSVLRNITRRCTATDLCYIVRLIKCDLRMNTGPKHFFDALDANAYALFQASSNIKSVIKKWLQNQTLTSTSNSGLERTLSVHATLMTPVKPMLAEACKSIEQAFKKCPNGMFAEIKYDGERVQIHKDGKKFQYFSRSLKPVQPHKIAEIKDFIPKACPEGDSLILDGEVLLMDTHTNKPLPFGTLGIHKKSKFKDATVCYVIFDILQFNNENLLNRTIQERREILCKNVKEIPHRIIHSEMKKLTEPAELQVMLKKCFAENLEGLVVKDIKSCYEPGKRHWLKIKKDYLQEGAMADSADLVVLGAYYGTGNKGGMMSVFLMGCYDEKRNQWMTVAKCGNGHDDDTLKKLQKQLSMVKINKEMSKVPAWLNVNRSLVPDFISSDPKKSQVWEISGAEFSQSTTHTADGISVRFPRVTKIRHDKDWKTATSLSQLKKLFEESKKTTDVEMDTLGDMANTSTESDVRQSPKEKPSSVVKKEQSTKEKSSSVMKKEQSTKEKSSSVLKKEDRKRKKKEKDDNEPKEKVTKKTCPYGKKCYRKSAEHLHEYEHSNIHDDDDDNEGVKNATELPKNPKKELHNLFTDMKFIFSKGIGNEKKLKRYIIAYDGDVLEDYEMDEATHVVSASPVDDGKGLTAVKPEWVWSCIKKKCVVPLVE